MPNIITTCRLASVPLILWLTYSRETPGLIAAAALFTLAAATDWLDGYLARRSGTVSSLGKLLDPLVDKTLILGVLFVLTDRTPALLPMWLALLNLFRELTVTAVRHTISSPRKVVGANWSGKAKLVLQVVVIESAYAVLLLDSIGHGVPFGRPLVFWVAVAMTAVSYFSLGVFLRRNAGLLVTHFGDDSTPRQDAP